MSQVFALLVSLAIGPASFGSGQQPCSDFVSPGGRSFVIASAYEAADLVVIGRIAFGAKPMLKIKTKIKGSEKATEIELTATQCQGTACSGGFSVAPNVDFLFLLKRRPEGVYDSVTGNGNFSCPVVYEVENGFVKFRDKKVPVASLEKFFQSKPDPIPLY